MKVFAGQIRRLGRILEQLRRDNRGIVALKFALVVPGLALLAVGAIDLMAVNAARTRLQSVADSSALAGAPSLNLATDGAAAKQRAAAFLSGQMSEWVNAPKVESAFTVIEQGGQRSIRVVLKGHRPSFFGSMLPPGGWNFTAEATASTAGLVPLCVLVTGDRSNKALSLKQMPRITAPGCMVHSNQDIEVAGGSISAGWVQAVGTATGVISPRPGTGAARIGDPFADLAMTSPNLCSGVTIVAAIPSGVKRVPPGVHCGGFLMMGTSELILEPGEHWFLGGALVMKDQARLTGSDVVLFFDKASRFEFLGNAQVNLTGRQSGPYAGIVIAAARDNAQQFYISADHVQTLLGVVYVPNAWLIVDGRADIARDSAWTVIVAKYLEVRGTPSLYINASYETSNVPVPSGVGPNQGGARLVN